MLKVAGCLIMLGQLTVLSVSEHLHRGGGGDTIRIKREETSESSTTTGDGLPPEDLEPGPSLGEILGLVALIITILYIFGISWKVMKIFKGEYVPTEPVYLKYK